MASLQVRDIPDELHERLRRCARRRNSSMSAIVLRAVERELDWAEWQERWESIPPLDVDLDVVATLDEVRRERDEELYGHLRR